MKIDQLEVSVKSKKVDISDPQGFLGSFTMGSDKYGAKFVITFDENGTQKAYQKDLPRSKGWAGLKRMIKCALFGHREDMTLLWWMHFNEKWKRYSKDINYCFRCMTNFGIYENRLED